MRHSFLKQSLIQRLLYDDTLHELTYSIAYIELFGQELLPNRMFNYLEKLNKDQKYTSSTVHTTEYRKKDF